MGQEIRKASERLNDKVRIAVLQKGKVFEQWQQQKSEQAFDKYSEERKSVQAVVREAERETEDRFGKKLS